MMRHMTVVGLKAFLDAVSQPDCPPLCSSQSHSDDDYGHIQNHSSAHRPPRSPLDPLPSMSNHNEEDVIYSDDRRRSNGSMYYSGARTLRQPSRKDLETRAETILAADPNLIHKLDYKEAFFKAKYQSKYRGLLSKTTDSVPSYDTTNDVHDTFEVNPDPEDLSSSRDTRSELALSALPPEPRRPLRRRRPGPPPLDLCDLRRDMDEDAHRPLRMTTMNREEGDNFPLEDEEEWEPEDEPQNHGEKEDPERASDNPLNIVECDYPGPMTRQKARELTELRRQSNAQWPREDRIERGPTSWNVIGGGRSRSIHPQANRDRKGAQGVGPFDELKLRKTSEKYRSMDWGHGLDRKGMECYGLPYREDEIRSDEWERRGLSDDIVHRLAPADQCVGINDVITGIFSIPPEQLATTAPHFSVFGPTSDRMSSHFDMIAAGSALANLLSRPQ